MTKTLSWLLAVTLIAACGKPSAPKVKTLKAKTSTMIDENKVGGLKRGQMNP